jgi:hypothetical protein
MVYYVNKLVFIYYYNFVKVVYEKIAYKIIAFVNENL